MLDASCCPAAGCQVFERRATCGGMMHATPLGREVAYPTDYAPEILCAIDRGLGRGAIGLTQPLPFAGVDYWTGYEVSWLDARGKPQIAVATFTLPAHSPNLIESKSFKLYLNSFNDVHFQSAQALTRVLEKDLSAAAGAAVQVQLTRPNTFVETTCELPGICVDDLDVAIDAYEVTPAYLTADPQSIVSQSLVSHLLKSNCPVTGQPDWASVMVRYSGPAISQEGFLRYIVSFRHHTGFHEQCVEQIFNHIQTLCAPTKLTVYARYTRRGGLDINPFRSNHETAPNNCRTYRQ